jgi:hypothetical protein
MPLADDSAPRVFSGFKEAPGAGHLGQAWRFAFEILTLVGGLEALTSTDKWATASIKEAGAVDCGSWAS